MSNLGLVGYNKRFCCVAGASDIAHTLQEH